MKAGRTLSELAAELERQTSTRKDYIAPQGKLEAVPAGNDIEIHGINGGLTVTPYAHGQLSSHLGIPKAYYDRMKQERPELLAKNVNTWLQADAENKRMIRAIDGKVRAVLSPKYRPLDNYDLASTILPVLQANHVQVMSSELTETRMYIKGILPALSDELPEGMAYGTGHHNIRAGDRGRLVAAIVISNSEVGDGTLRVEPSVFTTWCTNLAVMQDAAMKKYHVGRAHDADASWEVFADATRKADDAAFWLKVRDVTMAAFNEKLFRAAIDKIRVTASRPITSDDLPAMVTAAVEVLALPPASTGGILKHLANGGDLTQWGLSSAITRMANDADDYEYATVLERAGGKVIAMAERDWSKLAAVAA
jgi:hypothetical protein